jgi:peptide/nickel transport system ATP-binding protein
MLIATRQLAKYFPIKGSSLFGKPLMLKAVDGVNVQVREREVVGVVGESGSGKSTLGRLLLGLLRPTAGQVLLDVPDDVLQEYDDYVANGEQKKTADIEREYSVFSEKRDRQKEIRKKTNIVFQDPYSSLDPRLNVLDIIIEPILATGHMQSKEAVKRSMELLDEVGLPRDFALRYPHELSGGQKQRVALARGIATLPKFLVLDEPTSALDVSVQAQVLALLRRIREKHNIGMILITHNIAVISYMADQVNVMYAGKIVENGPKKDVILSPVHPYSVALISAVPGKTVRRKRIILKGDTPNLVEPPPGCSFHPRCPVAFNICGWTADEVATDLKYLIEDKHADMFKAETVIFRNENGNIIIRNVHISALKELFNLEKEKVRSLTAIDRLDESEDGVELQLKHYQMPKMYQHGNRSVSCFLCGPRDEK